jgi:PAS domain S-box-containing protein
MKFYKSTDYDLSSDSITSIIEDDEGYLWLGTFDGLYRFDKKTETFTVYKNNPDNQYSLSHNFIWSLIEDRYGYIWIGTGGGGLNRLDKSTGEFTHYRYQEKDPSSISSDNVLALYEDENGNIWIGTPNGISRIDKKLNSFIQFPQKTKHPISNIYQTIYGNPFCEDSKGNLWIGTYGEGLLRFNPDSESLTQFKNNPKNPNSLCHDRIHTVIEDEKGRLWIGTDGGGISILDEHRKTFTNYNVRSKPNRLRGNYISRIYEDRAGIIWIVYDMGGVDKYDRFLPNFNLYKPISENEILNDNDNLSCAMEKKDDEHIWVGTYKGGLNLFNVKDKIIITDKTYPKSKLNINDEDYITAIYKDITNEALLWIGTREGNLLSLNDITGEVTQVNLNSQRKTTLKKRYTIWKIIQDKDAQNILWIGADGYGLIKVNKDTNEVSSYKYYMERQSIYIFSIYDIYDDGEGNLWLATMGKGLQRFDKDGYSFYSYTNDAENPASIPSNVVWDIYVDTSGLFWVGTHGGGLSLFRKASGDFERYEQPTRTIHGILEDVDGNLWFSCNKGIAHFNPITKVTNLYHSRDVIDGITFNRGSKLRTDDGRLVFAGDKGLIHFLPNHIPTNPYKPNVSITSIRINGNEINHKMNELDDNDIEIEQGFDELKFTFTALNYSLPSKNRYAYMLRGLDDNWIYLDSSKRNVVYDDLSQGLYEFRVKASNNDGIWNNDGETVKIHVKPEINNEQKTLILSEELGQKIRLDHNEDSFYIRIEDKDYSLIETENKYMLEGYDTDWIKAENRVVVNYEDIPPGQYLFKYKRNNVHDTKQLTIMVPKPAIPFWKDWKVYAVFFPSLAIFLSLFYMLIKAFNMKNNKANNPVIVKESQDKPYKKSNLKKPPHSNLINKTDRSQIGLIKDEVNILIENNHPEILIVDDEHSNLQVLNNYFKTEGYKINFAESGIEAINQIENGLVPDVMILDIMMPKMSGYAVCEEVRKKYSANELPILMITAKGGSDDVVKGLEYGGNDYLIKPFNKNELKTRVKTLFKLKQSNKKLKELYYNMESIVNERTKELNLANDNLIKEIQKRKKQEELVKIKANRIEILNKIITAGNNATNIDQFISDILDIIINMTDIKAGNVYIIDDNGKDALLISQKNLDLNLDESYLKLDIYKNPQKKILIDGIKIFLDDYTKVLNKDYGKSSLKAALCLPIRTKEQIIGLMTLFKLKDHKFNTEEVNIIESVAKEVANMIHKIKAEKALLESENRYRSVVEDQTELIIRFKPDMELSFVNDAVYRYMKEKFNKYYDYDSLLEFWKKLAQNFIDELMVITPQNPILIREEQLLIDGVEVFMIWTNRGIFNEKGEIIEYQSVGRDITEIKKSEEALKESEMKYRSLFENMLNGMLYCKIIKDNEGNPEDFIFIDANEAFEKITGFKRRAIINRKGSDFKDILKRVSIDIMEIAIDVALYGKSDKYEIYHREPHDKWYYVHAYSNKKGYFAIVFDDISDRKRMEKQLKESEARYRAVVEDQTELIARFTPEGEVIFINEAYCNFCNLKKEELIGTKFPEKISKEKVEKYIEQIEKLTPDNPVIIIEDKSLFDDYNWIRWNVRAIFDDNNQIYQYLTVGRDITELKKSEIALKKSEKKFKAVFEHSPAGLLIFDSNNNLIDANQATLNIFGVKDSNIIKDNFSMFFTPENTPDKMLSLIEKGEKINEEYSIDLDQITNKLGIEPKRRGRIFIDISYTPIFIENQPMSYLVQLQDITNRKIAENNLIQQTMKLKKVNKELEMFTYTVSHDLRSPIYVINYNIQTLLYYHKNILNNGAMFYIDNIYNTSSKMLKLINDILNLSTIDYKEMNYDKVNLTNLALEIIQKQKSKKDNHFPQTIIDPDLYTYGDEGMIRILMDNIIKNAWKFTKGRKEPKIEVGKTEYNGEEVFYIKDNGVGFESEKVEELFEAFQTFSSIKDLEDSKGIGLSIVKRVINKHNGKIWAVGKPDHGATFYFGFNMSVNR